MMPCRGKGCNGPAQRRCSFSPGLAARQLAVGPRSAHVVMPGSRTGAIHITLGRCCSVLAAAPAAVVAQNFRGAGLDMGCPYGRWATGCSCSPYRASGRQHLQLLAWCRSAACCAQPPFLLAASAPVGTDRQPACRLRPADSSTWFATRRSKAAPPRGSLEHRHSWAPTAQHSTHSQCWPQPQAQLVGAFQ